MLLIPEPLELIKVKMNPGGESLGADIVQGGHFVLIVRFFFYRCLIVMQIDRHKLLFAII